MSFLVDFVATTAFMLHNGILVPFQIVFTSIWIDTLQLIVEPTKGSLKFTYDDVQRNLHQLVYNPFEEQSTTTIKTITVPLDHMNNFFEDNFFQKFLKDCHHSGTIGCTDMSTYLYLKKLLKNVEFIGQYDTTKTFDPVVKGQEVAKKLLRVRRPNSENYWDI